MKRPITYGSRILTILICAAFLISCGKEDTINQINPPSYERGEVIQSSSLGIATKDQIKLILTATSLQLPFELNYDVDVYSIQYSTIDGNGDPIVASGALFIPIGPTNQPMLSIQHGTETKRDRVASVQPNNSTEGIIGLVTASVGYYTLVPDYPGFGISMMMHPYHHAESIYPSVIDFMRAGRIASSSGQITLNGQVYLTGFSEGGYATLVTQRVIEENYADEFNLTAVAPLAGPYDLKGMFDTAFISSSYSSPANIAFFLTVYDDLYNWNRLDEFFEAPYAERVKGLFDGTKTWGEVTLQLPLTFSELIREDFATSYLDGTETKLVDALNDNTWLDWTPTTPLHFFHGNADEIAPYQNALTAIEKLTASGAEDIQLTTIEGGTHESSGVPAILGALSWFDGFSKESFL